MNEAFEIIMTNEKFEQLNPRGEFGARNGIRKKCGEIFKFHDMHDRNVIGIGQRYRSSVS